MSQNSGFGEHIDEYDVLGLLGKGGFATVYRARSKRNNQMVAIKMIDKKLIHSAGLTNRVRQEVEIHSRLKHPFVVELYTFFQDTDYVYLVMELATNGELQRYMREHMCRPMTEMEAATILQQVVSGILYLHSHSIMHRDISLSNLLLSKNMDVKIADFGLATQIKRHDEKHMTMCGTPNFISPEVASRSSHGLPADVWAIGCLLYTLLVGRPPFDTNAVQATLTKVVMSDYHLPDHLSFEAKDLINKLLKKDPNERIALQNIIKHAFMQRYTKTTTTTAAAAGTVAINTFPNATDYTNNSTAMGFSNSASSYNQSESCDSGIITFASSTTSSSFRPTSLRSAGFIEKPIKKDVRPLMGQIFERDPYAQGQSSSYNYQTNALHSKESEWLPTKSSDISETTTSQQNYILMTQKYNNEISTPAITNATAKAHIFQQPDYSSNMIAGIPSASSVAAAPTNKNSSESSCNIQSQRISVPPLNTTRLQPTRFRNKNAIMSILQDGEVVVEFIKFRGKLNEDRITDICWISKDGQRIVIYEPDPGRGLAIRNEPPELPAHDTRVGIFSYDNLPSKHWRKYLFASRFVSLVKASTPKVTYFSEQAKFHLMESMMHFEALFYDGSKVTQSPNEGLKVYNRHGQLFQPHELTTATATALLEHQSVCLKHCEDICNALELIHRSNTCGDNFDCFPVVIGRRPNRDRIGKVHDIAAALVRDRRNINAITKTVGMETTTESTHFNSYNDFKSNAVQSSRCALENENNNARPIRTATISGLGKATELSNGIINIQFYDGSFISVASSNSSSRESAVRKSITYVQSNGVATHFSPNDDLPLVVREKLLHLPLIEEQLRNIKSSSTLSYNDIYSTPAAPKSARVYTSTPALNDEYSTPSMRYLR